MKSILIIILLATLSLNCSAQSIDSFTFNGTITDERGDLITGGIVELKIDDQVIAGSATNYDGQFSITVTERKDYTLVIKSLGCLEQSISINKDSLKEINTISNQLVADPSTDKILVRKYPCEPPLIDTLPTRNTHDLHPDHTRTRPVKSVEVSDRDYVPYRNTEDVISTAPGVLLTR